MCPHKRVRIQRVRILFVYSLFVYSPYMYARVSRSASPKEDASEPGGRACPRLPAPAVEREGPTKATEGRRAIRPLRPAPAPPSLSAALGRTASLPTTHQHRRPPRARNSATQPAGAVARRTRPSPLCSCAPPSTHRGGCHVPLLRVPPPPGLSRRTRCCREISAAQPLREGSPAPSHFDARDFSLLLHAAAAAPVCVCCLSSRPRPAGMAAAGAPPPPPLPADGAQLPPSVPYAHICRRPIVPSLLPVIVHRLTPGRRNA